MKILEKYNKFEEALIIYDQIIELTPTNTNLLENNGTYYWYLAKFLGRIKEFDAALNLYNLMIQLNPNNMYYL